MFKNLTPRKIALFSSLFIALLSSIIIGLFLWYLQDFSISITLLVFLLTFLIGYFFLLFFIERFIYRRIKILYKMIRTTKASDTNHPVIDPDKDILQEVETEVEEWRKAQESEISRLKAMEQFRRDFIGNVAHELRTPLFNIQGYISTLLDGGIHDTSINIDYLQRAEKSVERMIQLVQELDTIAKLESGIIEMEMEKFDIVALVKDIFKSLELKAQKEKITLQLKENYNPIYVIADKSRIRQVLVNLLVNSINYGKENGHSIVKFHDMDEHILIEVSDNGIGIAPEHLPRIFERFYRVDKSRSREKGGSGLGLAIVKHILEAHHQTINVRSKPGVGTTFSFTLQKG